MVQSPCSLIHPASAPARHAESAHTFASRGSLFLTRVILAGVAARRGGPPHRDRSDNGPEFEAEAVRS
jgi:hypothetical protein